MLVERANIAPFHGVPDALRFFGQHMIQCGVLGLQPSIGIEKDDTALLCKCGQECQDSLLMSGPILEDRIENGDAHL